MQPRARAESRKDDNPPFPDYEKGRQRFYRVTIEDAALVAWCESSFIAQWNLRFTLSVEVLRHIASRSLDGESHDQLDHGTECRNFPIFGYLRAST